MNQDTRKDRRVKIVSLNVRYKSATVDEFIENHAHDVSRGGIYIKTANPFPPGTLLKFEIRLASDQAVIAGVGRVVWKRDAGTAGGERPSGMGVKFIKIDEPSKTVIDRLVNTRADAGKSFESEPEVPTAVLEAPTVKVSAPPVAIPKASAPPGAAAGALGARKATMMGLGIASTPPPALTTPNRAPAAGSPASTGAPAARPASGGMFPTTRSEEEMPPKQEQTVMKQAAELLEEALREAGGSMEEIGHNPLFSRPTPAPAAGKSAAPAAVEREAAVSDAPEVKGPSAVEKKPSIPPIEMKTPSVAPGAPGKGADDAAKARAMVAGMSAAPKKRASEPPHTTRESPSAKAAPAVFAEPAKKGGGGVFILLFVVVAAAAVALVMYREQLFGPKDTPAGPTTESATPPVATEKPSALPSTTAATTASAVPVTSASTAPSANPSSAPSATTTAAAATGAATATATAAVPTATATSARPTATATATATAAPTVTARPTADPTATAAPAATATATPTAATTATATAAPKPKPKPADDNPY